MTKQECKTRRVRWKRERKWERRKI